MDSTKENTLPNPREKANIFSRYFFAYTAELFKKGYTKTLDTFDLYRPIPKDKSKLLGDKAEKAWDEHIVKCKEKSRQPNLKRVIFKCFWPEIVALALTVLLETAVRLIQPFMLGKLLEFFKTNPTITKSEAFGYAAAVAGLDLCLAILTNQIMMNGFHYGMRVRVFCCALIYRKGLKLSRTALGESAAGKVVNLLSNDVSRFDQAILLLHYLWAGPVLTVIVMIILYHLAGYAGIIGMIPIFIIVPAQSYAGKLTALYRKQTALKTDERIRLTDEVLSGVRVIKMYAWEIPFTKLINWARREEVKILTKSSFVRGVFMAFKLFTTRVALFCTVLTMALTDQEVTASRVFVFALFFNSVSTVLGHFFVRSISETAEVIVSINRIKQFLMYKEFCQVSTQQNGVSPHTQNEDDIVSFKNYTAKWTEKSGVTLNDVNLKVTKGKLHGIIGPVGAGKSSLLQAVLGELNASKGSVNIRGTISYSCQEPWLFSATVRQNILFGSPYDKKRYDEVVKVCALERDFRQFPDGDMTLIGDHGGSLSGGQKARVNLARAVYKEADIYLLDDPLSAVDIHVAKHLYNKCINGYLANKTRILVTHQIYLLKDAHHIVVLVEGEIKTQGTYNDIAASCNDYLKGMLDEPEVSSESGSDVEKDEEVNCEENSPTRTGETSSITDISAHIGEGENPEDTLKLIKDSKIMKRTLSKRKKHSISSSKSELIEDDCYELPPQPVQEESSKGKVQGSLFYKYHRAGGNALFCMAVLLLYVLAQASTSAVDYFLSFWTNIEELRNSNSSNEPATVKDWPRETFVYIYIGIIVTLLVVALARSLSFYKLAMLSSQNLSDNLFKNVLYATMRFFDTNPSGRILNRFSKDLGSIDELLPKAILDAGQIILQLAGALVLVILINPYLLIIVAIICIVFYFVRKVFLKSSKNIKRLEGIMKGPVFTHMNATLQGLPTIRAYGAQAILRDEFDKLQDYHTSAWFMYIAAGSAFGFASDFMCACFTGFVTFSFLVLSGSVLGGDVGLAVSQAASLTGVIQWGMRQSAEVVNQLISVERVLEYDTLPKEQQPEQPKETPPNWPNSGQIVFRQMGLKYDESEDYVLKDLNVTIKPKEKIGIVGRTGAGKSSLISALFRLANVHGDIEIDQINTKDLILQELRARISIIPQDPVLFSGTLRYNLDPFGEYSDADLYKAINDVELRDPANKINNLDHKVSDRGGNYSVGQRQLICLARALVRKNKILMLDEATANVDPQTDALIQKTIREKFADCTVLTVAHRLNTIMDSDKVMVMDRGTILEFDHPYILLQNKDGKFHSMVMDTENNVAEQLKAIAKESYERRQTVVQ